jgi:hypothetical protein
MKWMVFIIVVVALAVGCMHTSLLGDCIGIAGCAGYALLPFTDTKHVRARWATITIFSNGLLGVAYATVYLLLHGGWLMVDSHVNHVIHSYLHFAAGLFLGITFTLMFSGQLFGTKRDDQEVRHEPAA